MRFCLSPSCGSTAGTQFNGPYQLLDFNKELVLFTAKVAAAAAAVLAVAAAVVAAAAVAAAAVAAEAHIFHPVFD